MNKDLSDESNCSDDVSLVVNLSNTQEKSIQTGDEETIVVKEEFLIDLNTSVGNAQFENFDREAYIREIKEKEALDRTITPKKNLELLKAALNIEVTPKTNSGQVILGRTGSRSDKTVRHVELPTVIRKRTGKSEIRFTMDIEKWGNFIPTCTGKNNLAEYINNCEIAISEVKPTDQPMLLKLINSRLAGNALEACKYRDTSTWENIKSILQGAFEHKTSERALSISLNCARMTPGETVAKFASRIEELYYKLCTASTEGVDDSEAKTIKKQNKKRAMIVFMTGLPEYLKLRLKARDPQTLEESMRIAIDEQLEYDSEKQISKIQDTVEQQNLSNNRNNNVANNANNQYGRNQVFNRGNNAYNDRGGFNNNFNPRNNNGFNNNQRNNNGDNNFNNRNFNRGAYNRQNSNNNYQRGNNAGNQNMTSGMTGCFNCGKMNHFAKDCWSRKNDKGVNNARQNTGGNANRGGQDSNFANNSRQNNNNNGASLHCNYCNKIGHEISSCYTKARNDKQNAIVPKNGGAGQSGVRLVSQIFDPNMQQDDACM